MILDFEKTLMTKYLVSNVELAKKIESVVKHFKELKDLPILKDKFFIYEYVNHLDELIYKKKEETVLKYLTRKKNILKYILTIKFYGNNASITASYAYNSQVFFFKTTEPYVPKYERKRVTITKTLNSFIKKLLSYFPEIKKQPVTLHIINCKYKKKIIKRLSKKVLILMVKVYSSFPYNGCRRKKARKVKKRTKRIKRFYNKKKLNFLIKSRSNK
jgi:hypothetical protein